jgi:hypothetical protein
VINQTPDLGQGVALAREHEIDEALAVVLEDLLAHQRTAVFVVGPNHARLAFDGGFAAAEAEAQAHHRVKLEAAGSAQQHAAAAEIDRLAADPPGAFAALGADGIAVTHADEADQLGIAAELSQISGMPVAYIHGGLELDSALSAADPSALAARLLP